MRHKVYRVRTRSEQDDLVDEVIGLGVKVHLELGPGLLEDAYQECLCWELEQSGLPFQRRVVMPLLYGGVCLKRAYLADIVMDKSLILEIKSIGRIMPEHEAQMQTYLRLSGCRTALLMNFNTICLDDGLKRFGQ
jgi:GxxExxY protein